MLIIAYIKYLNTRSIHADLGVPCIAISLRREGRYCRVGRGAYLTLTAVRVSVPRSCGHQNSDVLRLWPIGLCRKSLLT
jgi:hypothetical protein